MKAKVTSKAQITIPSMVRRRMNLKPGDLLVISEERPGKWFFSKEPAVNSAMGRGNRFKKEAHVSVEEMSKVAKARASDKFKATQA